MFKANQNHFPQRWFFAVYDACNGDKNMIAAHKVEMPSLQKFARSFRVKSVTMNFPKFGRYTFKSTALYDGCVAATCC